MLKPAIAYKDQLDRLFAEHIYDEDMFFYMGYPHCNQPPEIKAQENDYKWVYVGNDDKVRGYFAYRIDAFGDGVYNFGLYSFDKGNLGFIRAVYNKLEELVRVHRRIEWRCIANNPVLNSYKYFCDKHKGYSHHLHAVVKDNEGVLQDEYIFEIVRCDA